MQKCALIEKLGERAWGQGCCNKVIYFISHLLGLLQMYCNASGYKKRKTDADLEDELTAKDMTGFEVDFV